MKKIIVLLFSLVLILGYANIALAVDEEPATVETEIEQEEIIEEASESVVEEDACPHTWGEWEYGVKITYFKTCECGGYEELDEQTFYDVGGQFEHCANGNHYWYEDADIRYCELCGYTEEK